MTERGDLILNVFMPDGKVLMQVLPILDSHPVLSDHDIIDFPPPASVSAVRVSGDALYRPITREVQGVIAARDGAYGLFDGVLSGWEPYEVSDNMTGRLAVTYYETLRISFIHEGRRSVE